jgi:hypothetical protein
MPYIDLTPILLDPEIAGEKFKVVRRRESVNPFGQAILTPQTFNAIGQVSPTGRNSLIREQAFSSQEKTIRVITNFKLIGPSKDGTEQAYQPDLIFWKGSYYIVGELSDYSQYGAGFVSADCSSFDWTIASTQGPTGSNFGFVFNLNYNSANIPLCY